jgi:hypothetical protein
MRTTFAISVVVSLLYALIPTRAVGGDKYSTIRSAEDVAAATAFAIDTAHATPSFLGVTYRIAAVFARHTLEKAAGTGTPTGIEIAPTIVSCPDGGSVRISRTAGRDFVVVATYEDCREIVSSDQIWNGRVKVSAVQDRSGSDRITEVRFGKDERPFTQSLNVLQCPTCVPTVISLDLRLTGDFPELDATGVQLRPANLEMHGYFNEVSFSGAAGAPTDLPILRSEYGYVFDRLSFSDRRVSFSDPAGIDEPYEEIRMDIRFGRLTVHSQTTGFPPYDFGPWRVARTFSGTRIETKTYANTGRITDRIEGAIDALFTGEWATSCRSARYHFDTKQSLDSDAPPFPNEGVLRVNRQAAVSIQREPSQVSVTVDGRAPNYFEAYVNLWLLQRCPGGL